MKDLGTPTAADFLPTLTGARRRERREGREGDDAVITGGASSVVTDDLDTSRVLALNTLVRRAFGISYN